MKVLTLHQPWASLIALGAKKIETRSWPAPATLIGQRIAIHAAKQKPEQVILGPWHSGQLDRRMPVFKVWRRDSPGPGVAQGLHSVHVQPQGAVVATARLDGCVPMVDDRFARNVLDVGHPGETTMALRVDDILGVERIVNVTDQRPFGDFSPGRWAWVLSEIEPLAAPVPFLGGQGLSREWDPGA